MNTKLPYCLVNIALCLLLSSCVWHRPLFYFPDIKLENNNQPCISIPWRTVGFHNDKQFDIEYAEVFQVGKGILWSKTYFDSKKPNWPSQYYVRAGECLQYNYRFEPNIIYTVSFISAVRGSDEFVQGKRKLWNRRFYIKQHSDGTMQLVLDFDGTEGI